MTTLRSGAVAETPAAEEEPAAPASRPSRPRRDPWFDNVKMTLVTLVVVGHSWTMLPSAGEPYRFLYAWHIPAFVVVTGYLSRSFAWTPAKLWQLVHSVAVPYVVFEAALAWFRYRVGGVRLDELFTDPHWPMWYLSALFFWRLMAPAFLRLPRSAALAVAVAVSLSAGLWAGNLFDMARIFGLLPFFVLGLVIGDREWGWLRPGRAAVGAVAGFAAVLAFTRLAGVDTEWFYYRSRYDALEVHDLTALAIRASLLVVGLVGAASCFALVPRGRSWFSTLGTATLVVYLFHGFFVLTAKYEGYPDWADRHASWSFVVTTAGAVALALLLAAPPVARALGVLVDPIGWAQRHRRLVVAGPVS